MKRLIARSQNRPLWIVVLLGSVVSLLLFAQSAAAAETPTLEEVTPFQTLAYKAIYIEGIWAGIISGDLAEDAPLPARIEIGVPEGTLVGWFGQMPDSQSFEQASQFEMPYDMRTEDGMDIYSAILTSFRHVQLELRIDEEVREVRDDGTLVMSLSYAPVHDVEELFLTAAFPAGFVSTEEDLRFMGAGPNDEQTYARSFENVRAGETVSTTIEGFYVGEDTAAESDTNTVAITILVGIALVLAAGIYFFYARGKKAEK